MINPSTVMKYVIVLNCLFWAWVWCDVWGCLVPSRDRTPAFEEILPVYKFGGKALPVSSERTSRPLSLVNYVQQPSYIAVRRLTGAVTHSDWG
jgi:hypothetical protein